MKSIYACKLYRSSTRKEKIQCALSNPVNVELVKQLEEYLDEPYVDSPPEVSQPDEEDSTNQIPSEEDSNAPHAPHASHTSAAVKHHEGTDEVEEDVNEDELLDPERYTSTPEDIEESTSIGIADESILATSIDDIKSTLNSSEATGGVIRSVEKSNEAWIYYGDEINLNNVMTDVIELLASSGYDYLEFNRLARSANAIVFQINSDDTHTK